jgi:hypothetical protein
VVVEHVEPSSVALRVRLLCGGHQVGEEHRFQHAIARLAGRQASQIGDDLSDQRVDVVVSDQV